MSERAFKRILNADAAALCLVFATIQLLLYGVETAFRGTQTGSLLWVSLVGALFGLLAGKSRWHARHTMAATVVIGLIGVWLIGARIVGPGMDLLRSVIAAGPQIFPEIQYRFEIDARSIASAWSTISTSSTALLTRWQTWLLGAGKSLRLNDELIHDMIWTYVLWLLSAWIGWFTARRNGMVSLLPVVVLLTLLLWSNERRAESLWGAVISMLLLMGIWNYKNHAQHWEASRIDYSDSIRVDMSQYVLIVTVIVGLASYITPSVSWREIRDYFRERNQPAQTGLTETSSDGTHTGTGPVTAAIQPAMPREHLLTAGPAQSEELVMTIRTGELSSVPIQNLAATVPRHYWRSVVYDKYDGRGWLTTSARPQSMAANQPLLAGVLTGYKLLHIEVQMQQPEGHIFWSGLLSSADIPLTVEWRIRPSSNLFADQSDILQADMFAARTDATSYQVEAFLATPSIEQLQAAPSDNYPQRIRTLYLSLPDALPQRVHRLARQITEGQATTYDKAKAIETYLRTNYPYDLQISAPPDDQDVTDYFLFDLKRGYCDYYATAMVVLARSSGIPARFVSGYASGDYDVSDAQYVIRGLHAHSWVEVYFPDIGWVEFEPTGNQPEIERPKSNLQMPTNSASKPILNTFHLQLTNWKIGILMLPFAFLLSAAIFHLVLLEPLFFARMAPTVAIEILYRRMYRLARPLVGKPAHAETAHEFMSNLIQEVQGSEQRFRRSSSLLPKDVKELTTIYQMSLFSNHPIGKRDVSRALHIWNRVFWSLRFQRIKHFIRMRNKRLH